MVDTYPTSRTNPSILSSRTSSSKQTKSRLSDASIGGTISPDGPDILARIKSIFRKALITEDDEDFVRDGLHITAYVIRNRESHRVPHSGALGLKQSVALLTQPQNQNWFRTFAFLHGEEMSALQKVFSSNLESPVGYWTRTIILLERFGKARIKFWEAREKPMLAIIGHQRM